MLLYMMRFICICWHLVRSVPKTYLIGGEVSNLESDTDESKNVMASIWWIKKLLQGKCFTFFVSLACIIKHSMPPFPELETYAWNEFYVVLCPVV